MLKYTDTEIMILQGLRLVENRMGYLSFDFDSIERLRANIREQMRFIKDCVAILERDISKSIVIDIKYIDECIIKAFPNTGEYDHNNRRSMGRDIRSLILFLLSAPDDFQERFKPFYRVCRHHIIGGRDEMTYEIARPIAKEMRECGFSWRDDEIFPKSFYFETYRHITYSCPELIPQWLFDFNEELDHD